MAGPLLPESERRSYPMSNPDAESGRAPEEANRGRANTDSKGLHLYNVLGIDKKATDDDIKRAYRKLALRYHPDKNLDGDPEKTEKFKEVNYAHTILSNPKKRKVYDEYGETGLTFLQQFGDDDKVITWLMKPWVKWVFFGFGLITCGFFFCCCGCMCCCKCCCNFCCGKYQPKEEYDETAFDEDLGAETAGDPIVLQPGSSSGSPEIPRQPNNEQPSRPAVIAMPPPSTQTDV